MRGRYFLFVIITALASLGSCHTAKQSTAGSASIVGKYWKLVELNGATVQSPGQNKEPYMILNASEKRVTGNGSCNSFFGTYELVGSNGITFSKIGATRMACSNDIMATESQLFQAFEMTNKFTFRNDTLLLTKTDMSPVAKFVVSDGK
jgi:heat shock protein HslJ